MGCYLRAGNTNLPQWGFKQIEVTCTKENNPRDTYTHWNIEAHTNEKRKLPCACSCVARDANSRQSPLVTRASTSPPSSRTLSTLYVPLKSSTIRTSSETNPHPQNVAMMTSNNALVPDPDKQDDLASQWWQWPLLHVGLRMCGWDDKIVKYFLLGNPLVYWGSTAGLGVFAALVVWYTIRWQRGYAELSQAEIDQIHYAGLYPVIGWFLHYLPFVIMARVTYVHHYYPALYFAILTFGFLADWFLRNRKQAVQWGVYAVLDATVIGLYVYFMPICWGMVGPNKQYSYMKWFDSWRMADA